MIILRTVSDISSPLQLTLFTDGKGWVLRGPLHFSPTETTMCAEGPTALFTNGKDRVLRGPRHHSQMERAVCCGDHGTIYSHVEKTVCCEAHGTIHKRKGPCVAGPTALFTNGKDGVLRVPSAQGHMDRSQLDLLEDGNGLLMSEAGHRSTVHREYFIT